MIESIVGWRSRIHGKGEIPTSMATGRSVTSPRHSLLSASGEHPGLAQQSRANGTELGVSEAGIA